MNELHDPTRKRTTAIRQPSIHILSEVSLHEGLFHVIVPQLPIQRTRNGSQKTNADHRGAWGKSLEEINTSTLTKTSGYQSGLRTHNTTKLI